MEIKTTLFIFDVSESGLEWLTERDLLSWFGQVQGVSVSRTGDGASKGDIMGINVTSEDELVKRFVVHVALPKGRVGKKMRERILSISEIATCNIEVGESVVDAGEFCHRYRIELDNSRLVQA